MMKRTKTIPRGVFCAAAVLFSAGLAWAQSQLPVCAVVEDETVPVASQHAVAFTVPVKNLGAGSVGIYQYPLGGTLLPGNSATDFVFVPDDGFVGTTTFTFRVIPEAGCPRASLLGKVTLVGPTTERQFVPAGQQAPCGVTPVPVLLAGILALRVISATHSALRRKPQS
jgi:hypothetical protein